MFQKIINETSDFVNYKYPGLIFLSEKIFQNVLVSEPIKIKNNGSNPQQNLKVLFENNAEILRSQISINKKNCNSLLNLSQDLIKLFRLEIEMLFNNDKIIKFERRHSKELNTFLLDIKLAIEVINANITIDAKELFDKIIQKELLELNQKMLKLQNNFQTLNELELDSFLNIPDFIKKYPTSKSLEGFHYESSYQNWINFFEMNSINLNHACNEANNRLKTTTKNLETQTETLFFELQKIIVECQIFFQKGEESLIDCLIYAYIQLHNAQKKYREEMKSVEQKCLEINQNCILVINLKFLKKRLSLKTKPLLNELNNEIKEISNLPLHENVQLKRVNELREVCENALEELKNTKKTTKNLNSFFLSNYFRIFFMKLYTKNLEKFKSFKTQIKKNLFAINHLNLIKQQEIKFIDAISEIEKFLKIATNNAKIDNKQEGPPINFQILYIESNEHLTILNSILSELRKYANFKNLYAINNKFINSLQKGSEENDQLCLDYIAESEKLINDTYFIINNSFNSKIMKAIERSHVENENILKESKRIHGMLINLKNILENISSEEFVCSLVLKKKIENKFSNIKTLINNLEGLLLSISNCSFFNISQINSIMQCELQINLDKSLSMKKNEKIKRILSHIKDLENYLTTNQKELIDKVSKVIKERFNIEVKFYNYFLFMDEINAQLLKISEVLQSNGFNISLFDNIYLEKINELCTLFEEININSQEILSLNYNESSVRRKIQDNIKLWKENIENLLFLDEKSLPILKNKIKTLNELKEVENNILRIFNGIFNLAEKSPKKKKKEAHEKNLIEKFLIEVNNFSELHSEAHIARNYIMISNKKGNVNEIKIKNYSQLKTIISEIDEINRILKICTTYLKELSEEEAELTLSENINSAFDEGLITENDVVDENHDENLIRLRFKEFLKEKLLAFDKEVASNDPQIKELSSKMKKFLQSAIYL